MKLRVNRQDFGSALTAVSGVVVSRTPKPVLLCVMIDAQPDQVVLSCTDLEVGMRHTASQVDIEKTGVALVSAETLSRIIRESSDEVLDLELSGTVLHIRGEGSHFQIVASATEDFPPVPAFEGKPDFQIPGNVLQRMVEWTSHACAKESTRYAINGILMECKDGVLSLVATDGRRLSRGTHPVDGSPKTDSRAIVPVKALSVFARLDGHGEEPINVKVTKNQLFLQTARATVNSILVEGNFPDYHSVIPQDCDKVAEIGTAEFLSGLRRAALLTNEESRGVRLAFEKNKLTLSSRAPEQGEAMIVIPVRYTSAALNIGFNPAFIIDALKAARTERVSFNMKDPQKPGLLQSDENYVYVVMPVNL